VFYITAMSCKTELFNSGGMNNSQFIIKLKVTGLVATM
jgi:hypothetical protein